MLGKVPGPSAAQLATRLLDWAAPGAAWGQFPKGFDLGLPLPWGGIPDPAQCLGCRATQGGTVTDGRC